jgi:hypothetical protein
VKRCRTVPSAVAPALILGVLLAAAVGCGGDAGPPPAPPPLEVSVAEVVAEDVPVYGEWVGR